MRYVTWCLIVGVVIASVFTPQLGKYQQRFGRPWVAIVLMFGLLVPGWPLLLLGFGKELIALGWAKLKSARLQRRMAQWGAAIEGLRRKKVCQRCGADMPKGAWAIQRFRTRLSFPLRAVCFQCASLPWWRRW